MQTWIKLWQVEISDEKFKIVTDISDGQKKRLAEVRLEANSLFAIERGVYIRCKLIKNHSHRTLVNNNMMPVLHKQLEYIQQLDNKTHGSISHELLYEYRKELDNYLADTIPQIKASIFEEYEKEIGDDEIQEENTSSPAWRTLNECIDSIMSYANELLTYWQYFLDFDLTISREQLLFEIKTLPKLSTLGQVALEEIITSVNKQIPEWEPDKAEKFSLAHIEQEILSHSDYTLRLPRLVASLTQSHLEWDLVSKNILSDLSEPLIRME